MTAHVIAARRTAVMPRGGAFAGLSLQALVAPVILACLADAGLEPGQVDELILSNALGAGGNPARLVALAAGLPEGVAGLTLDRQCAGGLDALWLARALVVSGQAEVVLAGGVESYSRRPLRLRSDPGGGAPVPYDQPPFTPWPDRDPPMQAAAAALARRLGISRAEQDAWAVASHARARLAQSRLAAEIVPLPGVESGRDGFTRALSPALAARAPVLEGTITAANAAVAADGAAFCLVVSDRIARRAARALRLVAGATLGGGRTNPVWPPSPPLPGLWRRRGSRPPLWRRPRSWRPMPCRPSPVCGARGWMWRRSIRGAGRWRGGIRSGLRVPCWRCGCFMICKVARGWPPSRRRAGSERR
jgi:acetyl-CoA C-acetyltransferase